MNGEAQFLRVRDLQARLSVSKAWIFARLRVGELEGVKLGGVLLIRADSVERLLEKAEPWAPRPK